MNILHLSDIHFGIEKHKKGLFDNKQTILDDLITLFQEMEVTKKPQHVIVTGDVAWFGQKTEFDEARNWFEKLLNVLNLTGDDISFCVGNHDVDRNSSVGFDEKMFLDRVPFSKKMLAVIFCGHLPVILSAKSKGVKI